MLRIILLTYIATMSCISAHILNLTEKGDFREIFISGLAPKRVLGLEGSRCELRNVRLALQLDGNTYSSFWVDQGEISVLKGEKIAKIKLFNNDKLSRQEAIEVIENFLGKKPEIKDTSLLKQGWPLLKKNEKWRAVAGFIKTYDTNKPYRFAVRIQWMRSMNQIQFYNKPIPPPAGYKHVSMKPYERDSKNNPQRSSRDKSPDSSKSEIVKIETLVRQDSEWAKWLAILATLLVVAGLLIWLKVKFQE
jgi:hypothetical protein